MLIDIEQKPQYYVYKFVNPSSFMHVTAGSLPIYTCTKLTLYTILHTKFQYISTLKCIVCILITSLLAQTLNYKTLKYIHEA